MEQIVLSLLIVLGLVWGSFCNVLISRLPADKSIGGRSQCPRCKHVLSPSDLIPVVSYLLLKGRCRYCKEPVSMRYPIVEVLFAIAFPLVYLRVGLDGLQLPLYIFYLTLALVIFFTDFEKAIIPNSLSIPGMIVAAGAALFHLDPWGPPIIQSLLGGAIGGGVFMALYLITKGMGLGMGDVKLVFFMGLALGPIDLILAILIGSISGLILAGFVMLRFKRELAALESVHMHMDQEDEPEVTGRVWGMMIINGRPAVPFGSFLALGFLVTLLWGDILFGHGIGIW